MYRGLLPVLSSLYCSNFLYFYTFNGLKAVFVGRGEVSTSLQDLLFGYLAGNAISVFFFPLKGVFRVLPWLAQVTAEKSFIVRKKSVSYFVFSPGELRRELRSELRLFLKIEFD